MFKNIFLNISKRSNVEKRAMLLTVIIYAFLLFFWIRLIGNWIFMATVFTLGIPFIILLLPLLFGLLIFSDTYGIAREGLWLSNGSVIFIIVFLAMMNFPMGQSLITLDNYSMNRALLILFSVLYMIYIDTVYVYVRKYRFKKV